jgi:cell division protein ZapA
MSNVSIEIAGRKFTVACAEGEEEHVAMLGRTIDGKIDGMPHIANQSEARVLLFAALLLADENHELKSGGAKPNKAAADVAGPLETLAERLESLAGQLENAAV